MQANNEEALRPPVLVRAWGDEPVRLFLYFVDNNRAYVGSQNGSRSLGLPLNQVFSFDVDKMNALSTAFQQQDIRKLGEFWANMTVDDYACNKYQDNVQCVHDQESVSSSGSAKECGGR